MFGNMKCVPATVSQILRHSHSRIHRRNCVYKSYSFYFHRGAWKRGGHFSFRAHTGQHTATVHFPRSEQARFQSSNRASAPRKGKIEKNLISYKKHGFWFTIMSAHFICSDRLRLFRLVFKINIANPSTYIFLCSIGWAWFDWTASQPSASGMGGSCDITDENPTHIWPLPAFPTKL